MSRLYRAKVWLKEKFIWLCKFTAWNAIFVVPLYFADQITALPSVQVFMQQMQIVFEPFYQGLGLFVGALALLMCMAQMFVHLFGKFNYIESQHWAWITLSLNAIMTLSIVVLIWWDFKVGIVLSWFVASNILYAIKEIRSTKSHQRTSGSAIASLLRWLQNKKD